jgi:hypothetical protein
MSRYFSDPQFHQGAKVEEKCSCVHDEGGQDWYMNSRNSYPLLKPISGLVAPEFDSPNYRFGLFSGPMMHSAPELSKRLPGRPNAPPGSASLDPAYRPIALDPPKYGADTTGGSRWSLHTPFSGADPDPRGDASEIANTFSLVALIIALTPILIAGGVLFIIYYAISR